MDEIANRLQLLLDWWREHPEAAHRDTEKALVECFAAVTDSPAEAARLAANLQEISETLELVAQTYAGIGATIQGVIEGDELFYPWNVDEEFEFTLLLEPE